MMLISSYALVAFLALTGTVATASELKVAERSVFDAIDTDSDGKLDKDELGAYFKGMGQDEMPQEWWDDQDKDGDGTISWDEFIAPNESATEPSDVFDEIDTNSDGKLDRDEVGAYFEGMGQDEVPQEFWDDQDKDGDGTISWDEFSEQSESAPPDPPERSDFDELDTNSDGKLDKDEVRAFFNGMGQDEVPQEFWDDQDKDGDGTISWDEFSAPSESAPPDPPERSDFDEIDTNSDGKLDKDEVRAFFNGMGQDEVPQEFWDDRDKDGDGTISWDELSAPSESTKPERGVFDEIDTNSDGKLDKDEVGAHFKGMGQDEVPQEFWDDQDKDGDGTISWDEFIAPNESAPPEPSDVFDEIDTNSDGKLDKDEARAYFKGMGQDEMPQEFWDDQDKDGDGTISRNEFLLAGESTKPERSVFDAIDTNSDGKLDKDEIGAHFKGMGQDEVPQEFWDDEDKDGDGTISWDEFIAPNESAPLEPSVFDEIDTNSDGKLDKDEVGAYFKGMGQDEVPQELWDEDKDGDGTISWDEFSGPKGDSNPMGEEL